MTALSAALLALSLSGQPETVEIRYFDGDLTTPGRVAMIEDRIRRAAERVCHADRRGAASQRREVEACVAEAEARALEELRRRSGSVTVAAR